MDVAQLGHRLYTALDDQDWDQVRRLAHPELVIQVGSRPPIGFDEWRAALDAFHAGFPDGHHVIEQSLVSENHFITRCRFEGTHRGEFAGTEPTLRSVSARVIHVDRFEDDLLVEHHGALDMFGLLTQIDAVGS